MKTIEERAKEFASSTSFNTCTKSVYQNRYDAYINISKEQQDIDIENAIQCFKDHWREWLLGVDRDGMVGFSIDEKQIRKYMKGE